MHARSMLPSLLALVLGFALTACPETDDGNGNGDGETGNDDGADGSCDPVGDNPEMGALLNAPVAADVEVIAKTPQHPGPAGPENLP